VLELKTKLERAISKTFGGISTQGKPCWSQVMFPFHGDPHKNLMQMIIFCSNIVISGYLILAKNDLKNQGKAHVARGCWPQGYCHYLYGQ
jgi:hypothetical protein